MSYFNNAESQYIDFNGKCRILNFHNVSIAVSPLPPLNIPEVPKSKTLFATINDAIEFINNANLKLTQKDVDVETNLVKGLWVQNNISANKPPTIAFGYIPIDGDDPEHPSIKVIDVSHETLIDPIFVEGESYLNEARNNEKVAELLKEYSLYEWAQNPSKFGEGNFIVYEGRNATEYGISNNTSNNISGDISDNITALFELGVKHKTFYYRSKIIVPDKETITKLLSYVRVSALNDSNLERNYKYKRFMNQSPFYKSITDFEPNNDQFIFIGKGSLVSWLAHRTDTSPNNFNNFATEVNVINSSPNPYLETPYYYRNMNIQNGRVMLIQNTRAGNFPSALAVSKEWLNGTNVGYDPNEYPGGIYIEDNPSFEVYTTEGLTHKSVHKKDESMYTIFGYDSGSYAAILFL
jgi:hypothetical protein